MQNQIKAIETVYNGYRFRSRLEAKWAVFFDALGIKYEYEKEGFDLGVDGWYLPDFWLPGLKCWWEIKPISDYEYQPKCDAMATRSQEHVVVSFGDPCNHRLSAYFFALGEVCIWGAACAMWFEVQKNANLFRVSNGNGLDFVFNSSSPFKDHVDEQRMKNAALAARQARFEHGQTPASFR